MERREAPSPWMRPPAAALSRGAPGRAQPDRSRGGLWRAYRHFGGRCGAGDRARHHQRPPDREHRQGGRHPGAGTLRAAAPPCADHGRERGLLLGLVAAAGEYRGLRLRLLPGGPAARPACRAATTRWSACSASSWSGSSSPSSCRTGFRVRSLAARNRADERNTRAHLRISGVPGQARGLLAHPGNPLRRRRRAAGCG